MISFGINWDFIKKLLGIKSEDVPVIETPRVSKKTITRKDQILHSLRHSEYLGGC